MKVFLSHALDDKSHFDNIADALERENIAFWDPSSLKAGALLADQLRSAITECDACIFIATEKSVGSAWCGAELGAFWGANKPVLLFLADPTLDANVLPRQFQGHFVEKRISKVVEAVKVYLKPAQSPEPQVPRTLAEMSESDLLTILDRAIDGIYQQTQATAFSASVVTDLAEMLETKITDTGLAEIEGDLLDRLRFTLQGLLGAALPAVKTAASKNWRHQMQITTSTGLWQMYALRESVHAAGDVSLYVACLLIRYSENDRAVTAAISPRVVDNDIDYVQRGITIASPIVIVGRGVVGIPKK